MLKNHLKTAFRSLRRRISQTILNVTGLSVGFAAFLLIFLVIRFEQSFDTFHANGSRIYRVVRVSRDAVNREYRTGVPVPVTEGLRLHFPQLAGVACITTDNPAQVVVGQEGGSSAKKFKENEGVFVAEPQFFAMFDFPLVAGDIHSMNLPNNMLLTQTTATRYFGDWHAALGKTFRFDGLPMTVTGILKDMPGNTDFPIKEVLSYTTLRKYEDFNDWGSIDDDNYCFVQLKPGDSPESFIRQLDQFTDTYIKPVNPGYTLNLQPLHDIHYDARYGNYTGHVFSKDLIFALSAVGIFLLVIACVNFVNLSTAQAVNRAREVGVRKVLGGSRVQLIAQFLGEAGLIGLAALLLSLAAACLTLPAVNSLLDTKLSVSGLYEGTMLAYIGIALVAVILLSGFYPAFLLSGFRPVKVLKGTLSDRQSGGISLRRGLVVLQFAIAQVLIIATLVVASQMDYFNRADMGFNKDAIITAEFPHGKKGFTSQDVLRSDLLSTPGIEKVSFAAQAPVTGGNYTDLFTLDNKGKVPNMEVEIQIADSSYFGVYHIPFVAGRCFFERDTTAEFVVNQSVTRKLGYRDPREALGKPVMINGAIFPIVGVVKDFHIASFRDTIFPVAIVCNKHAYGVASVKVNMAQARNVIASMRKIWDSHYPDFTFEYSFMDQDIAKFYTQESQLSFLYKIFAALAIFISCLGLYGLISFMAAQRKKEIGIRKVLGAPIVSILMLLSKEFTLLIGIAFVLSAPVAWYFMHQWLLQYPYRIGFGAWFFIATMAGSVVIAWITVGYTAVKAARANPVKSLRTE